jgi:hypothetical protein
MTVTIERTKFKARHVAFIKKVMVELAGPTRPVTSGVAVS